MVFIIVKNRRNMKIKVDHSKCTLCGMCVKKCPVNIIKIKNKKVEIKQRRCIACRLCIGICPEKAIRIR